MAIFTVSQSVGLFIPLRERELGLDRFWVCYQLRKFPVKRQYSGTGKTEPEAQKCQNIPEPEFRSRSTSNVPLNSFDSPITFQELLLALKTVKNIAPGNDNIPYVLIKK